MEKRVEKVMRKIFPPKGFSLIELLVALFIISLSFSLISISFKNISNSKASNQIHKFVEVLKLTRDKSMILRRPFKVYISDKGYQVLKKNKGDFNLIANGPLRPKSFYLPLEFVSENVNIRFDSDGFTDNHELRFLINSEVNQTIFIDELGTVSYRGK